MFGYGNEEQCLVFCWLGRGNGNVQCFCFENTFPHIINTRAKITG